MGIPDEFARSVEDYSATRYRSGGEELQGDLGSDDESVREEEKSGEEKSDDDKGMAPGGEPIIVLPQATEAANEDPKDTSMNDRYVVTGPEGKPLPSDTEDYDVEASIAVAATNGAPSKGGPQVQRRLYSHVLSGADCSSDEERTVVKQKRFTKRKVAKPKRVLQAKKGEPDANGLVQTDITSFHGLGTHNKRSVADTSLLMNTKEKKVQKHED